LNDFSGQWLEVRNISSQQPAQQFQVDPTLRDAMARETELFFQSQVREDRPILDLLRANYTFLNERLAQHYGIAGIYGSHFRGTTVDSSKAFREALLKQGDEVVRTVCEKLLTYALGRGLTYHDAPVVRQLIRTLRQNDYKWSALLLGIVQSNPFQMRSMPES